VAPLSGLCEPDTFESTNFTSVHISGDLDVDGNATLRGSAELATLEVAGPAVFDGNVLIKGMFKYNANTTCDMTVGCNLYVTNSTFIGGGLTVDALSRLLGGLFVANGSVIGGGETVTGGFTADTATITSILLAEQVSRS
jgi:hypothetical protein